MTLKITTIRSGGQSGVDRAALDFARKHNMEICGWCPKGDWAEDYPEAPGILAVYPELQETPEAEPWQRTLWNMRDAQAILTIMPVMADPFTKISAFPVLMQAETLESTGSVQELQAGNAEHGTLQQRQACLPGQAEVPGTAQRVSLLPAACSKTDILKRYGACTIP